MGLFGGLFDKKECSICGKEIKLLGNKKLEDGNMCKECEGKLSPFFTGRRHTTVEDIREQLAYREANLASVATFNLTRTLGNGRKVLIDEPARKFMVTGSSKWRDENPDVMDLSQVTGCTVEVREEREEIRYKGEDGLMKSYEPKRWDLDYNIIVGIQVNHPYFDEINVKVNERKIEEQYSAEFRRYMDQAEEMRDVLLGARAQAAAEAAPKVARSCPHCGATCIPDAAGCCEYCGGAMV
ncbi:MAG: DUF4428 domain-containing protein [Coriobacteriaceae bacterium]|nr:DUF4428 domain-containing protein [Coriobacteriaceae bacterium]